MAEPSGSYKFEIGYDSLDPVVLKGADFDVSPEEFQHQVNAFFAEHFKGFAGSARVVFDDNARLIRVHWSQQKGGADLEDVCHELLNRREYEKAIPILWTLIHNEATKTNALVNLGMVLSDTGELEAAKLYLQQAVELGIQSAVVALGVAQIRSGEIEAGRDTLLHAVELDENDTYARQNLGAALLKLGDHTAAQSHLEKAVLLNPSNFGAMYGLAQCHEELDQLSDADEIYIRMMKECPLPRFVQLAEEGRTRIAQTTMRKNSGGNLRMDAMMYIVGALEKIDSLPPAKIKEIFAEVALLGMKGFDINSPEQKYRLKSLDGTFSGLHLSCYLYTFAKHLIPDTNPGIDFHKEYEAAKAMRGLKG